ncbi:hypothetical protein ACFCX7_03055 [Streptomyces microflavus]|uniref:hypothetical protein n=1 Tax=Streptomyces microflavus TaxID=1919 RepID=UPI0035D9E656
MFDRLEIKVLPPGPRYEAQLRFWVNGEDVVAGAVGEGAGGRTPVSCCKAEGVGCWREAAGGGG